MYNQKKPPMPEVAIDRTNMHGVQEGMMEQGQLGMTINGPWREAPLTQAGINYGVAKLPTLPNGNPMKPFLGVQAMLASAYSEKQEAALDFLNFVTQTSSVGELFKAFIKLPVRTTALDTEEVKANPNMAIWGEQAADAEPMPNIAAMSNVWTPWSDAMDGIIPENASDEEVKTLLDGAVENIKAAIAETEGESGSPHLQPLSWFVRERGWVTNRHSERRRSQSRRILSILRRAFFSSFRAESRNLVLAKSPDANGEILRSSE
jgi:maltose-binding protein MalE